MRKTPFYGVYDSEILSEFKKTCRKGEITAMLEYLMTKHNEQFRYGIKERQDKQEFLRSEILPELILFSPDPELTKMIGDVELYDMFLAKHTGMNLNRSDITDCIVQWAKDKGVEI